MVTPGHWESLPWASSSTWAPIPYQQALKGHVTWSREHAHAPVCKEQEWEGQRIPKLPGDLSLEKDTA